MQCRSAAVAADGLFFQRSLPDASPLREPGMFQNRKRQPGRAVNGRRRIENRIQKSNSLEFRLRELRGPKFCLVIQILTKEKSLLQIVDV